MMKNMNSMNVVHTTFLKKSIDYFCGDPLRDMQISAQCAVHISYMEQ